ncbi:MAG: TonB-dependent receptor plug domain-containing protein [Myxococcota bacterium]
MKRSTDRHLRNVPTSLLALLLPLVVWVPSSARADETLDPREKFEETILSEFPRVSSVAAFGEQVPEAAPAAVEIITAEDIRASGARTLAEALERVAGLELQGDQVAVRGLGPSNRYGGVSDASRVLLILDGVRMNSALADAFSVGLARGVSDILRIEILKGPASALYGTSAYAGVIQVVTQQGRDRREPEVELRLEAPPTLHITGRAATQHGELSASAYGRLNLQSRTSSSGEALERLGAGEARTHLTWRGLSWSTTYTFLSSPGQEGSTPPDKDEPSPTPEPPPPDEPPPGDPPPGEPPAVTRQAMTRQMLTRQAAPGNTTELLNHATQTARPSVTASAWASDKDPPPENPGGPTVATEQQQLTSALSWEQQLHRKLGVMLRGATRLETLKIPSQQVDEAERLLDAEGRLLFILLPQLVGTVGGELRFEQVWLASPHQPYNEGEDPSPPPPEYLSRQVTGGYGQLELGPLWETSLTLGLRVERIVPTQENELRRAFEYAAPRAGLVSRLPTGTYVKAFYGQAYQAPSLSMLFYESQVQGTRLEGNPALEPESLSSLEAELLQPVERLGLQVRLNVFQQDIQNPILPSETDDPKVLRFENREAARIQGAELSASWRPLKQVRLFGNTTLLDARFVASNEKLSLVAPVRGHAGVHGMFGPRQQLSLFVSGSYTGAQQGSSSDPIGEEVVVEALLRLDGQVSLKLGPSWQVALGVRNLLDAKATEFSQAQLYSTPGRQVWVELEWRPPAKTPAAALGEAL